MVRTKLTACKTVGGKAPFDKFQRPVTLTGSRMSVYSTRSGPRPMSVEYTPGVPKPKRRRRKCKTKFTHKKTHRAATRERDVVEGEEGGDPVEEEEDPVQEEEAPVEEEEDPVEEEG